MTVYLVLHLEFMGRTSSRR